MSEVYIDDHSGIVGHSNGSAIGNEFIRLMNNAKKERQEKEKMQFAKAKEAGAKLFHPWDGWFGLKDNDYRAGSGPYSKGSIARFIPPGYLYARFGQVNVGDFICIEHRDSLLMWEVIELPKDMFKSEIYILKYSHKL